MKAATQLAVSALLLSQLMACGGGSRQPNGSDGDAGECDGGCAGVFILSPNPIGFGYVQLGSSVVECANVSYSQAVAVTISATSTLGQSAFALVDDDNATPPEPAPIPVTIPARGNAKLCFSLTPRDEQRYNEQVTLTTDAAQNAAPVVRLTGWGGGPQLYCDAVEINFGYGASSSPLGCTNVGTAIPGVLLEVSMPTSSASVFSLSATASPGDGGFFYLAPGDTLEFQASYEPNGNFASSGTFFIESNGGQGQGASIPLTGSGITPPCTPSCTEQSDCGSRDGCGGHCNGACDAGACLPNCTDQTACETPDGCGGTCSNNCDGG